jgi:uncharacterized protein YjiS (DUF1127 family)
MNTFSRIFAGFAEGVRVSRFHHVLSQMSDHQLADIGVRREEIARRAVEMARQR